MIYRIYADKRHEIVSDGDLPILGDGMRYVEADAEGWIPHDGRECPLPEGVECDVKATKGRAFTSGWSEAFDWSRNTYAYRPILEAKPSEPEAPEWDGGLPPEGIECEVELESNEWQWCEIKAHRGSGSWIVTSIKDRVIRNDLVRFRPIRSQEDRDVEAMMDAIQADGRLLEEACRALYRAIKSGELKI